MTSKKGFTDLTAILATDAKLDSYGGFRFTEAQLIEKIESARKYGQYFSFEHDPSARTWTEIVDGGIQIIGTGERAAWVTIRVPNEAYEEVKRKIANGTLHGLSPNHFKNINDWGDQNPIMLLDADAEHWSPDSLVEIIKPVEEYGPVALRSMYQFSHRPPAVILLQYLAQIPPALIGALLYDLWRGTKSKEKILNLDILTDTKTVQVVIKGSSEKLVDKAVSNLQIFIDGDKERIIIEDKNSTKTKEKLR